MTYLNVGGTTDNLSLFVPEQVIVPGLFNYKNKMEECVMYRDFTLDKISEGDIGKDVCIAVGLKILETMVVFHLLTLETCME